MSEDQGNPTPIVKPVTLVPSVDLIHAAFAKAQGAFRQPELNRTAEIKKEGKLLYTTTYADLNQCIECIRQALSENELSFTQTVEPGPKEWLLVLTLRHSSGQYLKSFMPLVLTGSPQVIGGQLTYLKRYQISAFFGLAADFDDDGNAGSNTGNTGEFGDAKKQKGKDPEKKTERPLTTKEKQAAQKPTEAGPVSAEQYILPTWGGSNKGKALGSLDTGVLEKLRDHMKTQLTAKPKPKHIAEIATAYAHVKAVIADRLPPTPDDIPENLPRKGADVHPEDDSQIFPPDETEIPPSIDEFMIPKGVLPALDDIAGIPLKQISEKELRAAQKILTDEMAKGPKSKISAGAGFELRNKITEFFQSMGG